MTVWAWATATHSRRTRAAHRDDNCCEVMVKYEFSIQARAPISAGVVHPENGRQAKRNRRASLQISQLVVTLSVAQLSSYLQWRIRQAMGAWNSIQRSYNRSLTKTQATNDGRGLIWLFLRAVDGKMRCGHGGRVRMQDADVTATCSLHGA